MFVQVIASVRQKVDHCSYTIPNFEQLLLKARMTLIVREENWRHGIDPNQIQNNAVTVSAPPPPEPVVKGNIVNGSTFIIIVIVSVCHHKNLL